MIRRIATFSLTLAVLSTLFPLFAHHRAVATAATMPTISSWTDDGEDSAKLTDRKVTDDSEPSSSGGSVPQDRYLRADGFNCNLIRGLNLAQYDRFLESCPEGAVTVADDGTDCGPGSVELAALWVERLDGSGGYQPAELVEEGGCVTPGDVAAEAERAFAELKVTPPKATLQAGRPLLVNVHYPVHADAGPVEGSAARIGDSGCQAASAT